MNIQTGFVVESLGTVLRTDDGGATWMRTTRSVTPPSTALNGVSFMGARTGTVVGGNGMRCHLRNKR
jgi:photosystem II stability/assembly factor-like uncharacterized protein